MSEEKRLVPEQGRAQIIAATVLDLPNVDSDDDTVVLARQFNRAIEALQTIALLDPGSKGAFRRYQQAIQTARMALGLELK